VEKATNWLKFSFLLGAIADGVVAIFMFAQAFFAYESPLKKYTPEIPFRYVMGLAGSLMTGWTILLLWAYREPFNRKFVLIITNVVIIGLMSFGIFAYITDFIQGIAIIPILVFQVFLVLLFTYSYYLAGKFK
jgi:hypothetical protein